MNGLKQLNGEGNREKIRFDKAFLKALLVGLLGVRETNSHGVDKDVSKFIKGKNTVILNSYYLFIHINISFELLYFK